MNPPDGCPRTTWRKVGRRICVLFIFLRGVRSNRSTSGASWYYYECGSVAEAGPPRRSGYGIRTNGTTTADDGRKIAPRPQWRCLSSVVDRKARSIWDKGETPNLRFSLKSSMGRKIEKTLLNPVK
jgi:hypothetical protein